MSFTITDAAYHAIYDAFQDTVLEEDAQAGYIHEPWIRVSARVDPDEGLVHELISIDPDEHIEGEDELLELGIKVSINKEVLGFFENIKLDYKDTPEGSVFFFSKV